ncbi:Uncharacterised protein [Vibrio cholerae]|nr:Uncharacterised protein [Vibrio cholerae]
MFCFVCIATAAFSSAAVAKAETEWRLLLMTS